MESPTPVSRYIRQNSKKRVFPAGGSSPACKEVEVLEIPPPINRTPKPKSSSKQKEIIYQEIIDVDMEEDSDDAMLTDEVDPSGKGKEALPNSSAGFSGFANGESGSDTSVSNNGNAGLHDSTNPDDFSSNLFYGEDEWIDTYYDDILFDDYAMLESQFDHMDIPPGVEAPFPWFPSSPGRNDSKASMSGTSTNAGSLLLQDGIKHVPSPMDLTPPLNLPQSSVSSKYIHVGNHLSSRSKSTPTTELNIDNPHGKGKVASAWMDYSSGLKKQAVSSTANVSSQSSKSSLSHKYGKDVLHLSKSKRKSRALAFYNQYPSGTSHANNVNGGSSHPNLSTPTNAPPPGWGPYMPVWQDLPLNVLDPSFGPVAFMPGNAFTSWAQGPASDQQAACSKDTPLPHMMEMRNVDEILLNFDSFKKFDTVEDFSDHHYAKSGSSAKQPPKHWSKKIQDEWKILEKDLPDKIFVRVYDTRMDLLRAVIIGAEGTPYHDGLFFFDVHFPSSYPNVPPQVHYHAGGLRINPNLYNCGKVCLSLLNTWTGSQKEKWIPGTSTMLQVLVSIQGLILNAKPYFNEPGYANMSGTPSGETKSLEYNERTFMYSLRTMVYNMRRPPKHFEDFAIGYFCKHALDILVSCKAYMEGAQVGCLVKGGVQDVDEGDKSCSVQFKTHLASFIPVLVRTFSQIGVKDCEEFLSLAQKENEAAGAAAASRVPNYN